MNSLNQSENNFDNEEKIIIKGDFFKNLSFFVDVVTNKTNESNTYKKILEEYSGEVI